MSWIDSVQLHHIQLQFVVMRSWFIWWCRSYICVFVLVWMARITCIWSLLTIMYNNLNASMVLVKTATSTTATRWGGRRILQTPLKALWNAVNDEFLIIWPFSYIQHMLQPCFRGCCSLLRTQFLHSDILTVHFLYFLIIFFFFLTPWRNHILQGNSEGVPEL